MWRRLPALDREIILGALTEQFPEVTTMQSSPNPTSIYQEKTSKSIHPCQPARGLSCWHVICVFFALFWGNLLEIKFQTNASPRVIPNSLESRWSQPLWIHKYKILSMLSPFLELLLPSLKWLNFKLNFLWDDQKNIIFPSSCPLQEFLLSFFLLHHVLKATADFCAAAQSNVCDCDYVTHTLHKAKVRKVTEWYQIALFSRCPQLQRNKETEVLMALGNRHSDMPQQLNNTDSYITG